MEELLILVIACLWLADYYAIRARRNRRARILRQIHQMEAEVAELERMYWR